MNKPTSFRSKLRVPGTEAPVYDYDKAAVAVLLNSAENMANGMIAVAQISPDGAVVLNNQPVAPGPFTTGGLSITFPCNGFIVSISATTQDGALATAAGVSLRVQQNGDTDLFQSAAGGGAGFKPFAQLQGVQGQFPIRRRFTQATQWQVYIQNTTVGEVVCDVSFAYVNTSNPRI